MKNFQITLLFCKFTKITLWFLFCFSVGFDNFDLHLIMFHLFLFRHKNLIETYQPGSRASILPNVNSLIQKIPFQSILRILDIQGHIIYLISGFLRVINILPHRSFKYLWIIQIWEDTLFLIFRLIVKTKTLQEFYRSDDGKYDVSILSDNNSNFYVSNPKINIDWL